jgi:hypothetical protein
MFQCSLLLLLLLSVPDGFIAEANDGATKSLFSEGNGGGTLG